MRWLLLLALASPALAASTEPVTLPQVYWAIWGPLEVSTSTPENIGVSSGPVSNVLLRSQTTKDCYTLAVNPNGSLYTKWTTCPK